MFRFPTRRLLSVAAAAATPSPDMIQIAKNKENMLDDLSPRKITEILDSYIIGQADGKRAVAIALRNRWRRRQLKEEDLRKEVVPKNMLLIGPTGVGKTEISRRMARITDAPFIKVEATKYTEVGFKGKDVETIIEELYTNAKMKAKTALGKERKEEALTMALDMVYSSWSARHGHRYAAAPSSSSASSTSTGAEESEESSLHGAKKNKKSSKKQSDKEDSSTTTAAQTDGAEAEDVQQQEKKSTSSSSPTEREDAVEHEQHEEKEEKVVEPTTLEYFRAHYEEDPIRNDLVSIEITMAQPPQKPSKEGASIDLQSVGLLLGLGGEAKKPKITVTKKVAEAVPLAIQEALDKLIDEAAINTLARTLAEEEGVVFIDEIDKVVSDASSANADVSSTGVQQDLLPLIEGSNVTMKDGSVIATENILFICSGAFHVAKISDMIAELQGRLPVRVELKPLTEADFRRILTEPKYNLLLQQVEMMKTEQITVDFTEEGVRELAKVTFAVNGQGQNIGARRLNTILEKVMDEYSFNCEEYEGKTVTITAKTVQEATEKLQKNVNLAKYLL